MVSCIPTIKWHGQLLSVFELVPRSCFLLVLKWVMRTAMQNTLAKAGWLIHTQVWKWKLLRSKEGLREFRVTWCAWITKQEVAEPVALNLWGRGSWSCRDYFQKVERKMILLTTDLLVLPEQRKRFDTNLKGKEKLKIFRKMDTERNTIWDTKGSSRSNNPIVLHLLKKIKKQ